VRGGHRVGVEVASGEDTRPANQEGLTFASRCAKPCSGWWLALWANRNGTIRAWHSFGVRL